MGLISEEVLGYVNKTIEIVSRAAATAAIVTGVGSAISIVVNGIAFSRWGLNFISIASVVDILFSGLNYVFVVLTISAIVTVSVAFLYGFRKFLGYIFNERGVVSTSIFLCVLILLLLGNIYVVKSKIDIWLLIASAIFIIAIAHRSELSKFKIVENFELSHSVFALVIVILFLRSFSYLEDRLLSNNLYAYDQSGATCSEIHIVWMGSDSAVGECITVSARSVLAGNLLTGPPPRTVYEPIRMRSYVVLHRENLRAITWRAFLQERSARKILDERKELLDRAVLREGNQSVSARQQDFASFVAKYTGSLPLVSNQIWSWRVGKIQSIQSAGGLLFDEENVVRQGAYVRGIIAYYNDENYVRNADPSTAAMMELRRLLEDDAPFFWRYEVALDCSNFARTRTTYEKRLMKDASGFYALDFKIRKKIVETIRNEVESFAFQVFCNGEVLQVEKFPSASIKGLSNIPEFR